MISVLILTKNEELDLPGCLQSVVWSNDILVLDSYSTDRTLSIASASGARTAQRSFDNYAAQRNAGLHDFGFKNPWVLILDADERVPKTLQEELVRFIESSVASAGISAGRMRRRDYLEGTWLKYSQLSPFYIRLVRPANVHYEREVNEILKVEGAIHDFVEPFDHHPFSKGMAHWLSKHNVYSSMEADLVIKSRRGEAPFSLTQALFARDFNIRRYHQKELFYRLPARPLIKFLLMYIVKLGFLDGRAGFTYARLQSFYEYMIVLKTRELEERKFTNGGT